ncbi:YiaA/YiaB family inner membrane protein [Streptomyces sp. NBC_00249]|uniref:YiaA/YiaB family inner membrane protein n=1 Tax=Streptomyces sp. NBC_00249 TaxID=2975690 RepID=UPI00224DAA35|nr:YiaA/YiaB family inner membrane protein [Streptomyces sp. NBC_00249]MCX5197662.1 YiaA/YiaB family inner membrane protein [Streptomyces sp. NBC_00249]
MNETPVKQQNTGAYYGQAVASFGIAIGAVSLGIYNLDASGWVRAFLGIAVLYLTTSAFTLAKVIRDRQEVTQIVTRVDQARMEKLMAEYDPYAPKQPGHPAQAQAARPAQPGHQS